MPDGARVSHAWRFHLALGKKAGLGSREFPQNQCHANFDVRESRHKKIRSCASLQLGGRVRMLPLRSRSSQISCDVVEEFIDRQAARNYLLLERPVDRGLQSLAIGFQSE